MLGFFSLKGQGLVSLSLSLSLSPSRKELMQGTHCSFSIWGPSPLPDICRAYHVLRSCREPPKNMGTTMRFFGKILKKPCYVCLSDIVRAVSSSLGPVPCKSKPRENTSNIDGYPSGVTWTYPKRNKWVVLCELWSFSNWSKNQAYGPKTCSIAALVLQLAQELLIE